MEDRVNLLYRAQAGYTAYSAETLVDLHIDQILDVVLKGVEKHELGGIYHERPTSLEDVLFRQAIARELEEPGLRGRVKAFLQEFDRAKRFLAMRDGTSDVDIGAKWHLDAAHIYCRAINAFRKYILGRAFASEGLGRFARWLRIYTESEGYMHLCAATEQLSENLASFRYALTLNIEHNEIHLSEDTDDGDIYSDLFKTFERFELGTLNTDIVAFADVRMNSLERKLFAALEPRLRKSLEEVRKFRARYPIFMEEVFYAFEREAMFYISYLNYADGLRLKGYPFTYPDFAQDDMMIADGYDASLALCRDVREEVVFNDLSIEKNERAFLLTGPNQGGKTTFSRMFGQIFFFAALGLPVPCRSAHIQLFSGIATHFAVEEDPTGNSGRLQEELFRLERILREVPKGSIVILNELFSSTTTLDACEMGRRVLHMFEKNGCLCLYVTHIVELSAVDGAVALVAGSTDNDPPVCTFKITRDKPGGSVYADQLLKKYRLRRADIEERMHASFPTLS